VRIASAYPAYRRKTARNSIRNRAQRRENVLSLERNLSVGEPQDGEAGRDVPLISNPVPRLFGRRSGDI
jgi:hypothetical protein